MTEAPAGFCPYVGLAPFEEAHADYFFGRELDAAVMADNLLGRRVIVLYGGSGVGKTSVLNVGLPRALERIAKAGIAARLGQWHDPKTYTDDLATAFAKYREKHGGPLVIVLDQFEGFFVYGERERGAADAFVAALAEALEPPEHDAHLLIAIRADALHRLDSLRLQLPEVFDTTLELEHLRDAAVGEAVRGPIDVYNMEYRQRREPIQIDDELVAILLQELRPKRASDDSAAAADVPSAPIPLPFLQLALRKLWDAEGGDEARALTVDGLMRVLGGVERIAQAHVEEVLGRLESEEERRICATVFDRLVIEIGTKIAYPATGLARKAGVDKERIDEILNRLATGPDRILLTLPTPSRPDETSFEIFHDVLTGPLYEWKDRYEADRRLAAEQARLEEARRNEVRYLTLAAKTETEAGRPVTGMLLALCALPTGPNDLDRP